MIMLGTAIYALGVVAINIQNNLAEGGLTGITLILRFWFHIDPAISTIILNIPLILLGYRSMGKKSTFLHDLGHRLPRPRPFYLATYPYYIAIKY